MVAESLKDPKVGVNRRWLATLEVKLAEQAKKTTLVHAQHNGPLRVQRPFYPEANGTCHIYILHPPGGLVIGDELHLRAELVSGAGLITTPSAGKIYGTGGQSMTQQQHNTFTIHKNAVLEWLPQETIVFNDAAGVLTTRINLQDNAKIFGWDILRLGRIAGNIPFSNGSCTQVIEIFKNGLPFFIEKNQLHAQSEFMSANWGMQGANTLATLYATLNTERTHIDQLINLLETQNPEQSHCWGITQKGPLLLLRYLGNCVVTCRQGFTLAWHFLRKDFCGKAAVTPRIWKT